MHSGDIWNDLEQQRKNKNQGAYACIIWNDILNCNE